jgi:hypothetical protein
MACTGSGEMPVARLSLRVEKSWGYEVVWEVGDFQFCRLLHVTRGHRLWLPSRGRASEPVLLCTGALTLVFEDERGELHESPLEAGHVYDIPVTRRHRMIAVEDCDVFSLARSDLEDDVEIEEG